MNTYRSFPKMYEGGTEMKHRMVLVSLIIVVCFMFGLFGHTVYQANAAWYSNPPVQPGFPKTLSGANILESSTTLVDLDGNPNTLEIVFGGRDRSGDTYLSTGKIYAYRPDGQLYWQTTVRAPIQGSLAVADVDGDGVPEVLAPLGGYVTGQTWHGGMIALNGRTGAVEWLFDTQDWIFHREDGWKDGVYSSPAVGDLDADGDLEIVFGAWDQCIYALDGHGNPIWPELNGLENQTHCGGHGYYNEDTVWSSPALADLTGDGKLEIIIGADITAGNRYGDASGGYMYVLAHDGTTLAREWLHQVIYSSPAIADLEGDGKLDIVVGSGTFLAGKGYWVKVFNYNAAASLVTDRLVTKYTLPASGRVFASPAIADLNNDGFKDIVVVANVGDGSEQGAPNQGSKVMGWSGKDGSQMFATLIRDSQDNSWVTHSSPVIAEVGRSNDTGLKILFSHSWEVGILNANGTYYTDAGAAASTTELTYWTNFTTVGTPAVGDIDNDGKVEVVVGGGVGVSAAKTGSLYVWEPGRSVGALPWPMFRYNAYNSGNALAPELRVSTTKVTIPYDVLQQAGSQTFAVLNGVPGTVLQWQATVNWGGGPVWFTLDKVDGVTSVIDTVLISIKPEYTDEKGIYTATIHLECTEGCGVQTEADISVSFEVPPERLAIELTDPVLWVSTLAGTTQSLGMPVVNNGADGEIVWNASSNASWLTVTPGSGTTDDDPVVTLMADRTRLSDGTHYATVEIHAVSPADVEDADQTILVEVRVGAFTFVYLPSAVR